MSTDFKHKMLREHEVQDEARTFNQLMNFMSVKDEEPEQMSFFQQKLKKNRGLGHMTNKSGYTPLHLGIQMEASWKKILLLLGDNTVAKQRNPAGRLPLHMALDYYPKEEMLVSLTDMYPSAVRELDVDTRLPLHVVLEMTPFLAHFTSLAMKFIGIYPNACRVKFPDGRLPLHMALDRCLPTMLVLQIFQSYRSAAGVPKRDGKFPLNLALENEVEVDVVAKIVEAHPKALMKKMNLAGRRVLPLEYAMKKHYPLPLVKCLMSGGGSSCPRVLAYARAVAMGRIGKDCRAEGSSRGGKTLESVVPLTVSRHGGRLIMQEFDEHNDEDVQKAKCLIRSDDGLLLTVLCSSEEQVEDLRMAVQAAEAKALRLSEKESTWPDEQRLSYGANQLHNGHSLVYYGITKEVMIHLRQRHEALHEALRVRMADEIVLELLNLRPEAAQEDDGNGMLPLHIALMHDASVAVVQELIERYPQAGKLSVEGTLGQYPLHIALKAGYPPTTVEQLLRAKAHPTPDSPAPWEADWTEEGLYSPGKLFPDPENCMLPLHMAIIHCHEGGHLQATVELLVKYKCHIQARDRATGHSAVECCLAARRADDLFNFILEEAESQAPDSLLEENPQGQLPLHVACSSNASVKVVETLCSMDPTALSHYDNNGRLPLHLALANQMPFATIRFLLGKNGESVRLCDGQGHSPLQLAVMHRAAPGVVQQIVRCDPESIHVQDGKGRSILVMAVAANAPTWVLRELCQTCPEQVQQISILKGGWANTKAATDVMRLIGGRDEVDEDNRWKAAVGANSSGLKVHTTKAPTPVSEAPSEGAGSTVMLDAIKPPVGNEFAVEVHNHQQAASCEVCSLQ